MKKILLPILLFFTLTLIWVSPTLAKRGMVHGHKKPDICMRTNIQCVLKGLNGEKYWCLKSSIQRNLDGRRNTTPLSKTRRQNIGNCAKIIPID